MKINEVIRKVPNVVVHASLQHVEKALNAYADKLVKNKIRQDRIKKAWQSAKRVALKKNKIYNKFASKGNLKIR